jgi:MFS family permease
MISVFHLRAMRPAMRSLVFLYWIYSFVGSAIGVFLQVYLYELFSSVRLNIIAALISFTGIMIGFCVYGYIASLFRFNARHGFLLSFASMTVGILSMAAAHTFLQASMAMLLVGIGGGFFWLTIHTYELVETRDEERDVYSTMLSVGDQVFSLAGPAFATLLILGAHLLHWGDFSLLFISVPFTYLLGFFFFGSLSNYHPQPIRWHDVVHFVTEKRNRAAQFYLFGGSANNIMKQTLMPLVSLVILGTALNVGVFNTFFAVASAACLLVVGGYRHKGNRLFILAVTTLMLAALSVLLGTYLTFVMLMVFSFGVAVLQPLMRVSQHVIDLQTMDSIGCKESDFYPTMVLRDFSLWFWRMVVGGIFLVVIAAMQNDLHEVSIGMYFVAGTYIATYLGARLLLSMQPEKDI